MTIIVITNMKGQPIPCCALQLYNYFKDNAASILFKYSILLTNYLYLKYKTIKN